MALSRLLLLGRADALSSQLGTHAETQHRVCLGADHCQPFFFSKSLNAAKKVGLGGGGVCSTSLEDCGVWGWGARDEGRPSLPR